MAINRTLCVPCMNELKSTHTITNKTGRSEKITCWRCKKRRFGVMYTVEKMAKSREEAEGCSKRTINLHY